MADLYAASWRMATLMPEASPPDVLCSAVLYAAKQGWLLPDLADRAIPASTPHAVDKLRARMMFLRLSRETDIPALPLLAVLEAIPTAWHRFTPTMDLLHRVGRSARDGDGTWDRYEKLCRRAHTAQESER